jgi:transposase
MTCGKGSDKGSGKGSGSDSPAAPAGAIAMNDPQTSASASASAAAAAAAAAAAGSAVPFAASFTHFAGFDWAQSEHQVVAVDPAGQIVLSLRFADDAAGWATFRERAAAFPRLAVAIETSCGPAVERLLDMGLAAVYPMNPKAAERYRDRKAPAGAKDDALDAWSFADALRTDGHGWRPLLPQDPLTAELRMLCRDEITLIEQRTALVLQLQATLHEYYPAALEAFTEWATSRAAWELVIQFPDPHRLASAGKRKWQRFLHAHKLYRPATADRRLAAFAAAEAFASPNPAVTAAKSLLAVTLAKQLCTLESQLDEYRKRIAELFQRHPDGGCFGSLPGAGPKLAPRLLAEFGDNRDVFPTAEAVQRYAGTAPVTKQSGKSRLVVIRRACNRTLRATVHLWADLSRRSCAWAEAYYRKKKADGMKHAAALRCLGQRWLKILWKMWQTRTRYDEALHTRNQTRHGSWVLQLLPQSNANT